MPKSRAERARGRGKTPTTRAQRGAQKVARQDPETGVKRPPRAQAEAGWRNGPRSAVRRPPGTIELQVASATGNDQSQTEESRAQDKLAAERLSEIGAWPRRPRRSGPPSCGRVTDGNPSILEIRARITHSFSTASVATQAQLVP